MSTIKKLKINRKDSLVFGTSLKGYIEIPFSELKKVLGDQVKGDGVKVKAEWLIEGVIDNIKIVATIYDWCTFTAVSKNTTWNIGGYDHDALRLVKALFPNAIVTRN